MDRDYEQLYNDLLVENEELNSKKQALEEELEKYIDFIKEIEQQIKWL